MRFPKINRWLLGVFVFVALLRLPSFFEPHWYGDEEIYLVLGQMLRRGAVLYRDIWDNKTPLLYAIYAISPTLLWAKLSATIGVFGTILGIYFLAKKIFSQLPTAYCLLPTALVGILLSLTILEGTVANAELYFTLPIVLGTILIYKLLTANTQLRTIVLVGLLAATAFLLKVPAGFDFAGLLLAFSLIKMTDEFLSPTRNYRRLLTEQIKIYVPLALSFAAPIGLVFLYFFASHGLFDFVTAAFSQNASYVAVDSGLFQKLTNPLYVKGVVLFLGAGLVAWAYFKRWVSKEFVLLALWFGFSLYGALLSNRPYMHYLLQIVPPATLLLVYLLANIRRFWPGLVVLSAICYLLSVMFKGAFALDGPTYYQNFFDYISERKSWEDYVSYFDGRTLNYYDAAEFISHNTTPGSPIFVWGDVASIYTISQRPAATKFIQAHHLTTISPKNYELIMERLIKFQPKYILFSKIHFPFPKLETFMAQNYRLVATFGDISVHQNINPISPQKWSPNY